MKRLTLTALILGLALPLAALADPAGEPREKGRDGRHPEHQRERPPRDLGNLTQQEIQVLAQARALTILGTGATAQVTPLAEGGYQVELKNAAGETVHTHSLKADGRPERPRGPRPAGSTPTS